MNNRAPLSTIQHELTWVARETFPSTKRNERLEALVKKQFSVT